MPHVRSCRSAIVLALLPAIVAAEPARYALDPVHTRVLLAVDHAGFSRALGTVSGSTGTVVFDPDDWSSARLDVRVPLARVDFGDAKWNAAVLADSLLDADAHPEARFVSTAVKPYDAQRAQVCGELTLRGVTGPLCMDVTWRALKRHPLPPFRRIAGFSATATLSRSAFGISAWKTMIGDTVELWIEVEAVRQRGEETGADDALAPAASESTATPQLPR
jgi:polyisoprenoid-binding protein YceI